MATNISAGRYSSKQVESGISVPEHDYINLSYVGGNPTLVTYRMGGAGGTIVATVSMTYDGSGNLVTVQRVS